LDAMGDLCLLGPRITGRLVAARPGHGLIVALIRSIQRQPDAWTIVG
jgi:UDP-3-O-acyl-N-acetylglucosamine deacetylase